MPLKRNRALNNNDNTNKRPILIVRFNYIKLSHTWIY